MAQKLGYFEEAGLDLTIQTPSDPAAPIKQVAAGRTDLAISYEPEVILAEEKGLDVLAVGALVDTPLTSMIWLKDSKIGGVPDLRGKTIATAGIPYQDAYLKTILARAGLSTDDVTTVNVGYGLLPAIVGGRAQAMLGGFSNVEGVDLRLRGKNPVVTPVDQLGVPTYDELVFVAQGQQAGRRPAGGPSVPGGSGARHRRCRRRPSGRDRSADRSEPRPRPEADRGRGGGDPAVAETAAAQTGGRGNEARVRRNEFGRVGSVHRLDARPRPDQRPSHPRRGAQQRVPTGQDSQVARARPRGSAG